MSKAFTKESDDEPLDSPTGARGPALLPPGARNYMTPGGAQWLRSQLEHLAQVERPALEGAERGSDEWQQRKKLNQRIADLEQILNSVEIVPPPTDADAKREIVFGAIVTVREVRSGEESRYQIVGVNEVELGGDRVSLHAPIARALINRRLGERVRFQFPVGEEELEITAVDYE